jgi:hypothetical protein
MRHSSGLYRFLAIAVLLDVKDIPQVGPLQWGRITERANEMHVAALAGSPFMLCLRQFAFPHDTLMLFVCTLDAIFKLAPIVRQLLGHYIGPARHIATDCRPDVHGLPNPELMRGHRAHPHRWPTAHSPLRQIQISASLLVIGFGIFRFVDRRHPRVLARIRPTQLGLWSFAVAIAHGAGLMLVPIYLGLCQASDVDRGHEAAGALINANLGMAVLVSVVHSVAMMVAGGLSAWLVYRYLGLQFVSRSWFNLDATWAVSLILVGALSLAIILANEH